MHPSILRRWLSVVKYQLFHQTPRRLLLEHGADPTLPSRSGNTPLHDAALHGDAEAIGLLLAHGARINTPTLDDGSTALHLAASFDRLDAVKMLVQHGADTSLRNAG